MEGLDVHRNPAPGRIIDRRNVVDLTNTPSPVAEQRSNPLSNPNRSKTGSAPSRSDRLHGAALAPPTSTVRSTGSASTLPLTASGAQNRPQGLGNLASSVEEDFGSSILKSLGQSTPRPNHKKTTAYNSYIKPATPGAFRPQGTNSTFNKAFQPQTARPAQHGQTDGWPSWLINGQSNLGVKFPSGPSRLPARPVADDNPAEMFNLDDAPVTAEDDVRHQGDADDHMRELLSGAIGDAEGDMGDDAVKEGEDVVDGFAKGVRLMPHQVRGVRWMRSRESGRKYGGILADDMGLGKTVQTLARIVEGAPTAQERKAGFKGGTLIVAPLAVMEQWAAEVRNKTSPGRIKVSTHHGPSRSKSGKTLESFDVIITTFQTLASEFGAYETSANPESSDSDAPDSKRFGSKTLSKGPKGNRAAGHALFDVKWLRVVVDEAQNIKNKNTRAAKAAVGLKAKYRWCLTGTPIQNSVEELFSLFQFLRAKPLDDWHVFKERISSLVKDGRTKMAMKRLHVVLKAVMLRRTKDATIDGKPILNLPGRFVEVVQCPFDAEERAFYDALEQKTSLTFNKFIQAGTAMANYTSVLTMLLRLRQACDHPSLVTSSLLIDREAMDDKIMGPKPDEPDQADELADLLGGLGVAGGRKCEVCFIKRVYPAACSIATHACSRLDDQNAQHCKDCKDLAHKARARSSDSDGGLPPSSAKIRMLIKLLKDVEDRSRQTEKTIVFSQFTSFLNLIEPFLKSAGLAYVRYDGSMRNDKRQDALEKIKTSTTVRVILISFKCGSTGLNLSCCNNVILMDLWWNPALEDQAFDRAHRLGQTLDVNIFKLTIEQTVEDRILALQSNKRELAKAALSGESAKNLMKLTLNDIMNLFKRSSGPDDDDDDDDTDDQSNETYR